jgi:hypothetical protein
MLELEYRAKAWREIWDKDGDWRIADSDDLDNEPDFVNDAEVLLVATPVGSGRFDLCVETRFKGSSQRFRVGVNVGDYPAFWQVSSSQGSCEVDC